MAHYDLCATQHSDCTCEALEREDNASVRVEGERIVRFLNSWLVEGDNSYEMAGVAVGALEESLAALRLNGK